MSAQRVGLVTLAAATLAFGVAGSARNRGPAEGGLIPTQHPSPAVHSTFEELAERLLECEQRDVAPDCEGVVYVWSPSMPLSRSGIDEITAAADALGARLDVIQSDEVLAATQLFSGTEGRRLAARMIEAGVTLHAPAVLVHRNGRIEGTALLGYKTTAAYREVLGDMLSAPGGVPSGSVPPVGLRIVANAGTSWKDFTVSGQPGAYFRWVPIWNAVAFEGGGTVYLLDLEDGQVHVAPGFIDFVPSPDGRLFVTPGPNSVGLEFYSASEVFEGARAGRGREVTRVYADRRMQDQYPSVGILEYRQQGGETTTVYRVLTSWFDRVAYRDYEVTGPAPLRVRPIGDVVDACPGRRISIPILAQDGREFAARDEGTATTKIFRLMEDGTCPEAADLTIATGKVGWHADGTRLAFAIPEGAGGASSRVPSSPQLGADRSGIFVYDRRDGSLSRVEGSEDARRLAFPDFAGKDQVIFLLAPESARGPSRFRLVCCLP